MKRALTCESDLLTTEACEAAPGDRDMERRSGALPLGHHGCNQFPQPAPSRETAPEAVPGNLGPLRPHGDGTHQTSLERMLPGIFPLDDTSRSHDPERALSPFCAPPSLWTRCLQTPQTGVGESSEDDYESLQKAFITTLSAYSRCPPIRCLWESQRCSDIGSSDTG